MAWKPDYATQVELRDFMRISGTVDDTYLGLAVTAASRAIDDHTRRQFGNVAAEARKYDARFDTRRQEWVIEIDDLQDISGLTVTTGSGGTVSTYRLYPINAAQMGRPFETLIVDRTSTVQPKPGEGEATLNGKWGWTTVPTPVKEATLLQGSRLFSRRTSPYGIAGSPDVGSELRLLAKVDPDVAVALRDYRRWAWVG